MEVELTFFELVENVQCLVGHRTAHSWEAARILAREWLAQATGRRPGATPDGDYRP